MKYRAEIDGLRAIAVLPVLMFHAKFPIFSGGYIGVDVFFVISGYLITTIIVEDLQKGEFSIADFYERRARRILPALFLVVSLCVPFGWLWLLPTQFKDLSQSVIATVLFSSNFHFWLEEGYFDAIAGEKPLLHTWSLAVEEQYYMLFPIVLGLLWRFKNQRFVWLISGIAIVSLVASEWGWRTHPSANFYLLPFRTWELLTGSLCAIILFRTKRQSNNWLSMLGLILISTAVLAFDDNTPMPSIYGLVPVLGTALIILYGTAGTWTARLLSAPPVVAIGLISYSTYLWHQPLFAFARARTIFEPTAWTMLLLMLLSLVLGYFSWRFVEKPFRKTSNTYIRSRKAVFAISGSVGTILLIAGFYGHFVNGLNANRAFLVVRPHDANPCFFGEDLPTQQSFQRCKRQLGSRDFFVLIGDSHAKAISRALRKLLQANNLGLVTMAKDGCFPVPHTLRKGRSEGDSCLMFANNVFDLAASLKPKAVIVAARWALNIEGTKYTNSRGFEEVRTDAYTFVVGDNSPWKLAQKHLIQHIQQELLKFAQITPLVIIAGIPEAGWPVPKVAMLGGLNLLKYPYSLYFERNRKVRQLFRAIQTTDPADIMIFEVADIFCPPAIHRQCVQHKNGELLYFDDDHPSDLGAELIAAPLVSHLISRFEQH